MKHEDLITRWHEMSCDFRFILDGYDGGKRNGWQRLLRCTASYKTDPDFDNLVWLMSYRTIVAVWDKETDTLISFGRFSATTYQHVRKFRDNVAHGWRTNETNLELENWY